jgi:hypothetical protein
MRARTTGTTGVEPGPTGLTIIAQANSWSSQPCNQTAEGNQAMRRRITRALFTAAAAGATITSLGFAAAGPADAAGHGGKVFAPSGGTPIPTNADCPIPTALGLPRGTHGSPPRTIGVPDPGDNCGRAGYQANGRNFRFAQALIRVPDHTGAEDTDPVLYIALDNSSSNTYQYTRVGIAPCAAGDTDVFIVPGETADCPTLVAGNTSGWVAFTATADAGGPPDVTIYPISNAFMGDGITVSAYLVPTGNAVATTIQLPDGTTYNNTFPITGPVYTRAQALADWTTTIENDSGEPWPPVPSSKVRDSQFFQGRFTTSSGQTGTFRGPWKLNPVEVTSNGTLPPTGALIAQPSYLWNDQNSFNGKGLDAFGVWRYPY